MSLIAMVKRIVSAQMMQLGQPRVGIVASVNPSNHTARVTVMPDGTLSGWIPIKSEWIGNGWGLVCLPSAGDQVALIPHDGDANNLMISGRIYSQAQMPPVGVPGEFWLVHSTGATIKLVTSGAIVMNAPGGFQLTGNAQLSGNLSVTGTITSTGDMVANGISLENHTHQYKPGTGSSTATGAAQG